MGEARVFAPKCAGGADDQAYQRYLAHLSLLEESYCQDWRLSLSLCTPDVELSEVMGLQLLAGMVDQCYNCLSATFYDNYKLSVWHEPFCETCRNADSHVVFYHYTRMHLDACTSVTNALPLGERGRVCQLTNAIARLHWEWWRLLATGDRLGLSHQQARVCQLHTRI
jgi:hypothetical protein